MEEVTLYFKKAKDIELSDPLLHILSTTDNIIDICHLPFPVKIFKNHLPANTKSLKIKVRRKVGKAPELHTDIENIALKVSGDIRIWSHYITEMWESSKRTKNEKKEDRDNRIKSFIDSSKILASYLGNDWKKFIEGRNLRHGLLASLKRPEIITLTNISDELFSVSYAVPHQKGDLYVDPHPKTWLLDVFRPWLNIETKSIPGLGYEKNPCVAVAEGDGSPERWNEIREFRKIVSESQMVLTEETFSLPEIGDLFGIPNKDRKQKRERVLQLNKRYNDVLLDQVSDYKWRINLAMLKGVADTDIAKHNRDVIFRKYKPSS